MSDENCKCRLKLGSSKAYKIIVAEQKLKTNNNRTLEEIFTDEIGKQVFLRIGDGKSRNYNDVWSGTKKS